MIDQQMSEMEQHTTRIEETWRVVKRELAPARIEAARAALDAARTEIERRSCQCRVALWEINLIRWENRLRAFYTNTGWDGLDYDSCKSGFQELDIIRQDGKVLLSERHERLLNAFPDEQGNAGHLKEALSACKQLAERLVDQQAALAVAPMRAAPKDRQDLPGLNEALARLARLTAHAELGTFQSRYVELEHARVKAEQEIDQMLSQLGNAR